MAQKCRICLNETENMKLLTAEYLICDKSLPIYDIITLSTNIQMSKNDDFPNYICNKCLQDADTSFRFKKRCEESENLLISQLNSSENQELKFSWADDNLTYNKHKTLRTVRKIKYFSSPDNSDLENYDAEYSNLNELAEFVTIKEEAADKILKYEKEKDENGFYVCLSCPESFSQKTEVRKHIISHETYSCKLCPKKFTLLTNLRRHYKLHDNLKNDSNEYTCIACSEIFPRRKYLSEHLRTHKEFICRLCSSKFSNASNLRKHINWHNRSKDEIKTRKQPPIEDRTCDICFKSFKYRPSMLKHRRKHGNIKKVCKFCSEAFENSIKLYKHMEEAHKNEKNVVCSLCGKKFFREWNLKMHLITHTGLKPYMCEICGVSFALAGNLTSHKRLHTGSKPYKCPICSRSFTQQAALRSHEATHSSRRDFVCPDCGAAFSRAGALRNHRKRHSNLRPFSCTMCDKSFTFSSERKRHMQVHTGEKNYICDFCGKAFNRPANLNVHRRIHTGEFNALNVQKNSLKTKNIAVNEIMSTEIIVSD